MNKSVITLLGLLLCTVSFSQNFSGGIISGVSTSQVSGDELSGFNKIGPKLGLYINRSIKWYGLQLELQYITKGSKKNNTQAILNTDSGNLTYDHNNYNLHLEYIGVPIFLFSNIRKNIQLEFGTSFNFLIKQKEEIDFYLDNSRQVNNLEAAILIGLTYQINDKISLNTRLINSITPIRPHASGETYRLNKGQYNTALGFSIYYRLKN